MDKINDNKSKDFGRSTADVGSENDSIDQQATLSPPPFQLNAEPTSPKEESKEENTSVESTYQLAAEGLAPPPDNPNGGSDDKGKPNNTGLPTQLKTGIENLSGFSLDDVKVHYNSDKPSQLQAHAYAQGTDIHVASGQEKHLPHEAWHVVQQKQGRVQPTTQLKAFNINDDAGLEKEADVMGAKALQTGQSSDNIAQKKTKANPNVVQRAVGFEFETGYVIEKKPGRLKGWRPLEKMEVVKDYNGVKMEADVRSTGDSVIEMVMDPPVQEDQPQEFANKIAEFRRVGDILDGERRETSFTANQKGLSGPSNVRIKPRIGGFDGNLQVTGGIAFSKLFQFLQEATAPRANIANPTDAERGQKELTAKIGDTGNARLHGQINHAGGVADADAQGISIELKGMLSLISLYLNEAGGAASDANPMLNYAKLISGSFMSRTDFGSIFNSLPDAEKTRFVNDRTEFVNLALNAAQLAGTGYTKVYERGIRTSNNPTDPGYNTDITNSNAELGTTRENWLRKITQGHDILSSYWVKHNKSETEGLGALGPKKDKVGQELTNGADPTGIILELRNMRTNQRHTAAATILENVFQYIVEMNQ